MDKEEFISLIKNSGLKKQDIARYLGVSRATINNWERGKEIPDTKIDLIKQVLLGAKEKDTATGVDSVLNDPYILKEIELRALKKAFYWMQNPEAFKEYLETEGR